MRCATRSRPRTTRLVGLLGCLLVASLLAAAAGNTNAEDDPASGERAGRPLAPDSGVWFEEVVTFPLTDWTQDERVTTLDEYVVVRNHGTAEADITGWILHMLDGTDETLTLDGTLSPGAARLIQNPPGQINNDVRLLLEDAHGNPTDDVTLGADGVPLGRGSDHSDEAVHLTGPWAGLRGPGTLGNGLPAVWASHTAAGPALDHSESYTPAWLPPEGGRLHLRLYAAPGIDPGETTIRIDGGQYGLTPAPDSGDAWQTPQISPLDDTSYRIVLEHPEATVQTYPAGNPLTLLIDQEPPRLQPLMWPDDNGTDTPFSSAVADSTKRVHWFPTMSEGPSGIIETHVQALTQDHQAHTLDDCVPLESPGPGCQAPNGTSTIRIITMDGAGRNTSHDMQLDTWQTGEQAPAVLFDTATPPELHWNHTQRPLRSIHLETTANATESWPGSSQPLSGNDTRYTDTDWTPGESRAYRLRILDLASHETIGAWQDLPPHRVPVAVTLIDSDPERLAKSGETEAVLHFDRELETPPTLLLRLERPRSITIETHGQATVDPHVYSYLVRLPDPPGEAVGQWNLEGGLGQDGAPVAPFSRTIVWDHEGPRIATTGASHEWITTTQHTVTLTATDTTDPAPTLQIIEVPKNATRLGDANATTQLALAGDGVHTIRATANDTAGNQAERTVRIHMDATPPHVAEHERGATWSTDTPLRVQITDATSGVNRTSLKAWVRDKSGAHEARIGAWDEPIATLLPQNGTDPLQSPFEVYLAVADHAGNGVEGLLGGQMRAAGTAGTNSSALPHNEDDGTPSSRSAPSFLGPAWQNTGDEESRSANAQTHDVENKTASKWSAFDWDGLGAQDDTRSIGWYMLGFAGIVGLGTAVHQVHRRRRNRQEPTGNDTGQDVPTSRTDEERDGDLEPEMPAGEGPRRRDASSYEETLHATAPPQSPSTAQGEWSPVVVTADDAWPPTAPSMMETGAATLSWSGLVDRGVPAPHGPDVAFTIVLDEAAWAPIA